MNRTALNLVGVALATSLLTGCSGGAPTYSSGSAVAKAIGCTGYKDDGTYELFVQDSGSCSLQGVNVDVRVFGTDDAQHSWTDVARTVGVGGGKALSGPRWIVDSTSAKTVAAVRAKIGGDPL